MTDQDQKVFQIAPGALVVADHRLELGDLGPLRDDIAKSGIKDPLITLSDGLVVAGSRRYAAAAELAKATGKNDPLPVIMAADLEVACRLMQEQGSHFELPLKPSEQAALGLILERADEERAQQAKALNAASNARLGSSAKHVLPKPKSVQKKMLIPPALGLERRYYETLIKLMLMAQDPDSLYQADAQTALREGDEGVRGAVRRGWDRVKRARERAGEIKPRIVGRNQSMPGYKKLAAQTTEQAWRTVHLLDTAGPALVGLDPEMIRYTNTDAESAEMLDLLQTAVRNLREFQKALTKQIKLHENDPKRKA